LKIVEDITKKVRRLLDTTSVIILSSRA